MLGLFVRPSQKGGFYRTFLVHFFHKKGSKCEIFAPPPKKADFWGPIFDFFELFAFCKPIPTRDRREKGPFSFWGVKNGQNCAKGLPPDLWSP